MSKTGKMLAFKITCTACDSKWIMMRDRTFNIGCPVCFDKKTVKELDSIWIEVEKCVELDPGCFED